MTKDGLCPRERPSIGAWGHGSGVAGDAVSLSSTRTFMLALSHGSWLHLRTIKGIVSRRSHLCGAVSSCSLPEVHSWKEEAVLSVRVLSIRVPLERNERAEVCPFMCHAWWKPRGTIACVG